MNDAKVSQFIENLAINNERVSQLIENLAKMMKE